MTADAKETRHEPGPTEEQKARAVAAAAKRAVDPLRDWARPVREECPLCFLPYPIEGESTDDNFTFYDCCGKKSCNGCLMQRGIVSMKDSVAEESRGGQARSWGETWGGTKAAMSACPFCRETERDPGTKIARMTRQAERGNQDAMYQLANYSFNGGGCDEKGLLVMYESAAKSGSAHAAFALGNRYSLGDAVGKDDTKALEYYFRAAELGFVEAFDMIGHIYMKAGEVETAMLNFRKAAICGFNADVLFKHLRDGFMNGYITKEEYAYTLRENQASVGEMKSESREIYKLMQIR